MKLLLSIKTDISLYSNPIQSCFLYADLPLPFTNYTYFSGVITGFWNSKKRQKIMGVGIHEFSKKWNSSPDKEEFYKKILEPARKYEQNQCSKPLKRKGGERKIIFVINSYCLYRNMHKLRSEMKRIDLALRMGGYYLSEAKEIPTGFLYMPPEDEILSREIEIDVDLGEGEEGLVGYLKRLFNLPIYDMYARRVMNVETDEDEISFDYHLMQRIKLVYTFYRLYPDIFSKIYPNT